jgi:hypothetical protein
MKFPPATLFDYCAALWHAALFSRRCIPSEVTSEYEKAGPEPSNTRYGYVVPNGPMDHSVFASIFFCHSGATLSVEPGISRFPDVQSHI